MYGILNGFTASPVRIKRKEKPTHYASCQEANESDTEDYWSDTACGLNDFTSIKVNSRIDKVTCKKCIKRLTSPPITDGAQQIK